MVVFAVVVADVARIVVVVVRVIAYLQACRCDRGNSYPSNLKGVTLCYSGSDDGGGCGEDCGNCGSGDGNC